MWWQLSELAGPQGELDSSRESDFLFQLHHWGEGQTQGLARRWDGLSGVKEVAVDDKVKCWWGWPHMALKLPRVMVKLEEKGGPEAKDRSSSKGQSQEPAHSSGSLGHLMLTR